jgi:hypothetical protein
MAIIAHRQPGPPFYLETAVQYYALGRHAILCRLNPAANIIHHAAEMMLKFRFLVHYDLDGQRQRVGITSPSDRCWMEPLARWSHNLERIWKEFKAEYPDLIAPNLSKHDGFIKRLHSWETIRYPTSAPSSVSLIHTTGGGLDEDLLTDLDIPETERYGIDLEETDSFFRDVVVLQLILGHDIRIFLNDRAYPMYLEHNHHIIPGGPSSFKGQNI